MRDLPQHLAEADIVITSTASREPVITRAMVEDALRARRRRPMFLVDIAVPRDIAADVAELDDVFLYTIDDLKQVIDDNLRSRQAAAREAEAIIDLQVEHYLAWRRALELRNPLAGAAPRRRSAARRGAGQGARSCSPAAARRNRRWNFSPTR